MNFKLTHSATIYIANYGTATPKGEPALKCVQSDAQIIYGGIACVRGNMMPKFTTAISMVLIEHGQNTEGHWLCYRLGVQHAPACCSWLPAASSIYDVAATTTTRAT